MNKFKLKCSWTEYHSGELIVEAEDKNEAIEILRQEQSKIFKILIDKYSYDTFLSLSEIVLKKKENVDFNEADINIKDKELVVVENDL